MNKKLVALRNDRKELQAKAGAILDKDDHGPEDLAAYDKLEAEIKEIDALIDRHERHLSRERSEPGEPDANAAPAQPKGYNPFANLGEQCMAAIKAAQDPSRVDPRLLQVGAASGMSESVPAEGGYWVQKQTNDELLQKTFGPSQILPRCRRIAIGAGFNGTKLKRVDEDSRADGSRWGGITSYWAGEGQAKTPSFPKTADEDFKLQKIIAYCQLTDELMEDAVALNSFLEQAFPEELRFRAENAVLNGDGAGKPLGILKSGAVIKVARSGGANTISFTDVVAMLARCWTPSFMSSIFTHSQDAIPQLFAMTTGAGGNVVPVYLPANNNVANAPPATLWGKPTIPTEHNPKLGTAGDLLLADFGQYVLIDKGDVKTAVSIHVKFLEDEQTLRFTYRVNGQPWWRKPLTPANGSTSTLSPFVAIT